MLKQSDLFQMENKPFIFDENKPISTSKTEFFYRLQKIVSYQQSVIGYEILLDFSKAQSLMPDGLIKYTEAMNDGRTLNYLLSKLISEKIKIFRKKIFINVERVNLRDKMLLRKINLAAKKLLRTNQIQLIVEITERNPCPNCIDIIYGLVYLKNCNVLLAVDDFDIYAGDFRQDELNIGMYDFIKIIMPKSAAEAITFNDFLSNRNEKIILEMVEEHHRLAQWNLHIAYGYQGFAYS